MQVLTNTFAAGPHKEYEVVLDVRDDKWQMEVRFEQGSYTIYCFRLDGAGSRGCTAAGAEVLARDCAGGGLAGNHQVGAR